MTVKTAAGAIAVGLYIVGFAVYPPPEKDDSNLLMRVLWPIVAAVEASDYIFAKK